MLKKAVHLACVLITALCVLVQSMGAAAGGVLCVGCSNFSGGWGGIGLTSAPCTPINGCCTKHTEGQTVKCHPDGEDENVPPTGCDCFDITLSPNIGTLAQPPVKIAFSLAPLVVPSAMAFAVPDAVAAARPRWGARAGPDVGRLLAPLARQTVRLI